MNDRMEKHMDKAKAGNISPEWGIADPPLHVNPYQSTVKSVPTMLAESERRRNIGRSIEHHEELQVWWNN